MTESATLTHIEDRSYPVSYNTDEALSDACAFRGVVTVTVRDVVITGVLSSDDADYYTIETKAGASLEFHRDHVNRLEFYTAPEHYTHNVFQEFV